MNAGMNYLKGYFSEMLDFSGEEKGKTYRRYCLIHSAGLLVANTLTPVLFRLPSLIAFYGIKRLVAIVIYYGLIGLSILWVEPMIAATIRRTWTIKRSKAWALVVLIPYGSMITWLVLGKDNDFFNE